MFRMRSLAVGLGGALAGVTLLFALSASAGGAVVSVGSASAAPGANATVSVQSQGMAEPGLGAWAMNIVYNPSVVHVSTCAPATGSVCNPNFAANTVRITGAVANGLVGDATLATVTFTCAVAGSSPLTLTTDTLADATIGGPQDITATIANGTITCAAPAPTAAATATPAPTSPVAGFGPGSVGPSTLMWLVAGLLGAGLAWLTAGLAGAALTAKNPRRVQRDGRIYVPRMRPRDDR
jgi:hypothetical protein